MMLGSIKKKLLVILLIVLTLTGCQRALSVIFDIPPKNSPQQNSPQQNSPQQGAATAQVQQQTVQATRDTLRPPIETILVADSVRAMLPRDHAGNIDWMEAMRDGTIRPRNAIRGDAPPPEEGFQFGFDFSFRGPAPAFDAYFPHSAHTQLINCQQCHGPIFKYRDTEFQMADVLAGNYCGECHGKVSFPPVTACERCHVDLPQPANRAQPHLLGTIRMTRVARVDSVDLAEADSAGAMAAVDTMAAVHASVAGTTGDAMQDGEAPTEVLISESSLPPAVFPHWVHRIRYTCKVCHMDLFEPEAGANAITMADISAGEACGTCHNGSVAFSAGFGECQRCHTPEGSETL